MRRLAFVLGTLVLAAIMTSELQAFGRRGRSNEGCECGESCSCGNECGCNEGGRRHRRHRGEYVHENYCGCNGGYGGCMGSYGCGGGGCTGYSIVYRPVMVSYGCGGGCAGGYGCAGSYGMYAGGCVGNQGVGIVNPGGHWVWKSNPRRMPNEEKIEGGKTKTKHKDGDKDKDGDGNDGEGNTD